MSDLATVTAGTEPPPLQVRLTRADLVRYAGASGDFNPIHWSDRVAADVGLPGVIAHGMLTMALIARLVTGWAGGEPSAVRSLSARFTRPVVVPDDDDGALIEVAGKVREVISDGGRRVAKVALTASCEGNAVGRGHAEIVLAG